MYETPTSLEAPEVTWVPHSVPKTLIWPGCKMPGLNMDSLRKHFQNNQCVGRKEFAVKIGKTMRAEVIQCLRCEYRFSNRVSGTSLRKWSWKTDTSSSRGLKSPPHSLHVVI